MTWAVVAAVLLGALLHAAWNALVKSGSAKDMDIALLQMVAALWALPVVVWLGWPVPQAWPYLAASSVIHVGYYSTLVGAYRRADLSLTYPLMRGLAPLLVALGSALLFDEHLSAIGWVGVGGICAGVLVLGLQARALQAPAAMAFAVVNAVMIACYTVVDGMGVRLSGNATQYIAALFLVHGWPFVLLVVVRRRSAMLHYARARWPLATGGALATIGSYGIALWAMTRAPVALVAALRETSVLFAVALGVVFLREEVTLRRLLGAGVIVAGVVGLRMGAL